MAQNEKKTLGEIKAICRNFITELGSSVDDQLVFSLLAEIADSYDLELRAEQRGINGTYIHFVRKTN